MLKKVRRNPIQNAVRLKTIVAVLAKHGFQDVLERAGLKKLALIERLILTSKKGKDNLSSQGQSPAERLRLAFEELGPTFIKLGQLLATRPDLIPIEYVEEFKKLHSQVRPLP